MKTKRERFEKIASYRVQKILNILDSLGKCSNKNNYEYDEADLKKMERILMEKLNEIMNAFKNELNKGNKPNFKF